VADEAAVVEEDVLAEVAVEDFGVVVVVEVVQQVVVLVVELTVAVAAVVVQVVDGLVVAEDVVVLPCVCKKKSHLMNPGLVVTLLPSLIF
jgi:hypothetical protein